MQVDKGLERCWIPSMEITNLADTVFSLVNQFGLLTDSAAAALLNYFFLLVLYEYIRISRGSSLQYYIKVKSASYL